MSFVSIAIGFHSPLPMAVYTVTFTPSKQPQYCGKSVVYSAERARRTSCHPELASLRYCLRLRKTTPAPLAQALSQLVQCGLGVWSYQPQRVRPCTDPSTLCCLEI